jgi:hypothetical protein
VWFCIYSKICGFAQEEVYHSLALVLGDSLQLVQLLAETRISLLLYIYVATISST